MGKVNMWQRGGDQDKFIIKLIKRGKVNKFTTADTLKTEYPGMFSEFSLNVIRNHLNVLKRNNGLYFDGPDEVDDVSEEEIDENTSNDPHTSCNYEISGFNNNIHQNYPILCEIFKDPENHIDKVMIAVTLPSGVQNVKMELNDDGTTAIIKYSWPKTMFDMEDMFKKQIAAKQIHIHHPKILCLKNGLEKVRKRIDATPEAFIKIDLPIKVLTAIDSWTKSGLKRKDGTQIVMAEFKGYIKDYNKKLADSIIKFDM